MNLEAVESATRAMVDSGVRVLSPWLLGPSEEAHVDALLAWLRLPHGARVLDAGCGTGEVARLMAAWRPDLEITLLNLSEAQLAYAPADMPRVVASFDQTGLPDRYFDVVLFSQAFEHSQDTIQTLTEAARVTRFGGLVAIFGMVDRGHDAQRLNALVGSWARTEKDMRASARLAGLIAEDAHAPIACRPLESPLIPDGEHARVFEGVAPFLWRFTNLGDAHVPMQRQQAKRIGFQFSGGRDSMAALWVLRPYWDQMSVYHLETGDRYPETAAIVDWVSQQLPRPVQMIHSNVPAYHEAVGWPSDVVPTRSTPMGQALSGERIGIVDRFTCCATNLMLPLHQRMVADGVQLIVRGQRDEDYQQPPLRSGDRRGDMEVFYPIQSWSTDDVDAYCTRMGLPMAPWYAEGAAHGSDCLHCTAWWDDGRFPYMRRHHPEAHATVMDRLEQINVVIVRQFEPLTKE